MWGLFTLGWVGPRELTQSQRGNSIISFLEELATEYPGCFVQGCGTLGYLLAKGPQPVANWKSVTWLCFLTSPYSSLYPWLWFTQWKHSCKTAEVLLPLIFLLCMSCNFIHGCIVKMAHHCFMCFLVWDSRQGTQIRARKLFSPPSRISKLAVVS